MLPLPGLGVVVLAAGAGQRLQGWPKCLVQVNGQPLLQRLVTALQVLQPAQTVVVLGHHAERVARCCAHLPVHTVRHADPAVDQVASLRLGLGALDTAPVVLVALADQPLIDGADLLDLARAWCLRPAGTQVLQPQVQGQPGNPVILDAAVCQAILAGPDALGCKQWQAQHPAQVYRWPSDNTHFIMDIDTQQDLHTLQTRTGWTVDVPLEHE